MRALQGIVFQILIILFSGCGGKESTGENVLDPSGDYKKLKEEPVEKVRCGTSGYGCGRVATSGNLVQGSFTFENLFVHCAVTEEGFVIDLDNTIASTPTFKMHLILYGLSEPDIYYSCKGGERAADGQSYKLASCDLFLKIHSSVLAATQERKCEVSFEPGSSPLMGKISCAQLEQSKGYVSIAEQSEFTCQTQE